MSKRIALLLASLFLIVACAIDRSDHEPSRTPAEVDAEVARLRTVIASGGGDATRGQTLFGQRCGACHTLHAAGGQAGPDLTPYFRERTHLDFILRSVVTPDVMVHEYHPTVVVRTRDGMTRRGTIVHDSPDSVVLAMPGSREITLRRTQIESIQARNESLMPAQLLAGMSDADLRDLFEYILR